MNTPELSPEAIALYELLMKAELGEVIPYAALSSHIGIDVRSSTGRTRLYRAMQLCVKDRAVFRTIRKVGVQRVPPGEVHRVGQSAITSARRTGRRAIRKLGTVDLDKLSKPDAYEHMVAMSVLIVGQAVSAPKNHERILGAVQARQSTLPPSDMVALLDRKFSEIEGVC